MIKTIYLEQEYFKDYNTVKGDRILENLSKLNIFIGTNNSGKSRFTRNIFSHEKLKYISDEFDFTEINSLITRYKKEIETFAINELRNAEEVYKSITGSLERVDYIHLGLNLNSTIRQFIHNSISYNGELRSIYQNHSGADIRTSISKIAEKYLQEFDNAIENYPIDLVLKNTYIPTLRGMRRLDETSRDVFLDSTINDYFKDIPFFQNNIITGLKLNEDIREHLLGSRAQRKQVRDFENFLSKTFFDGKEINIIPKTKGGVVHFMIDNEEKEIYNLGDGIQSIIILTYPLFFNQDKTMNFFIEEPEHYLHPGFQRIFIETLLLPQFKNFQYFITTHSNHLLDTALDTSNISIYTFKRKQTGTSETTFIIENVENEDLSTLELIGVRNSSLFLSNSTIWVEGITDRIYLRKYLDIYQKDQKTKFVEDIHYSFIEYGGGNITHWSFLENSDDFHPNIQVDRLCAKLFLISDRDGTENQATSKKALRQKQLSQKLGERYYCLDSIEIENLLLPNIIKKVITEY